MKTRVPSVMAFSAGLVVISALLSAQSPPQKPAASPSQVTFARDIQPILEKSCSSCHSSGLKLADLDLSNREAAMKGGEHGPVIVAGSADKSKLYRMVAGLDQPAMPMDGDPLKPAEVAAIKTWIDQGAKWETAVSFAKDIQPIFERSCWTCHGATMQLSKLDLRTREGALRGGAHGPAATPGNADQSRLYRAVAHLDAIKMPMQGDKLKPEEIAAFKAWIDQGMPWDASAAPTATAPATNAIAALENMEITPEQRNYWFFKVPVQKTPPVVAKAEFSHPIDRFLEAARAEKKLPVAPRADKRTLIRRAYIDLTGLPPSPADVDAFVADQSADAWDKLIAKLLASPQYGERWGRHWLDVARYADSNGFEQDYDRPNAWRYRDYVINAFNQDKPYNQFLKEQIAGDELDYVTHETLIATGFLRAGPRVLFREKDNPERRWDYVDDLIATLGRGVMGVTVNCARCHNHKFDPIAQKDYYSLAAAVNGWVETDWPLVSSRVEAETYLKKTKEIDDRIEAVRDKIRAIEKPYRDELRAAYIKKEYPENVQKAVFKPEAERTPGEQLLATQVLTGGGGGTEAEIEKMMKPEELTQKKELTSEIAAIEKQRPKAPPMAEIITDGDWRFAPMGRGDETIGCPKCRLPPPDRPNGTFLHEGPGRYEPPPTNFLIRGDPESKGSLMKPGFLSVALHGEHPIEIPRPDGRTSGRRLALAEWLGSNDNPLTARVIVNRVWHHHFGRGIVATLDNFGKMGEQPTHPELLDYLAVEFMKRGWSFKQLHRFIMTSEAYQMTSVFDHGGALKADPENRLLWRYRPQRLDAETIRDAMLSVAGNINLSMGGQAFFPHVPKEILVTEQTKGRWDNQPDGPATWRRSVYIYQRRSLPYPMFETFDHPDMNLTAGARNVSVVPTQALTLLNNPFVIKEAELLAERIKSEIPDDAAKQIDLGYKLALGRPATDLERSLALEKVKAGSLVDFTHVLLNLSEFLYMR